MISFKEIETIEEAFELAKQQTRVQLNELKLERYRTIVFLSKSFGTACAAWYESQTAFSVRQVFLTPTPQALPFVNVASGSVSAMILGDQDHLMPAAALQDFCSKHGLPCRIIPGVAHKLRADTQEKTNCINPIICQLLKDSL